MYRPADFSPPGRGCCPAPEARQNVAQRVSAGYCHGQEPKPRKGRKIGRDWSYAPPGLIHVFASKPSAHALGYILSRLRRWATAPDRRGGCAIKKMAPFLSGADGRAKRASPIGRSHKAM